MTIKRETVTGFEWWDSVPWETTAYFRTAILDALRTQTCIYSDSPHNEAIDDAICMFAGFIAEAIDDAARLSIGRFDDPRSPEGVKAWKDARQEALRSLQWQP